MPPLPRRLALPAGRRPSVRQQHSALKFRNILDAAKKIFATKGFHEAKITDIAREANVASGTIYLYFKNKDDILIKLFEEAVAEITAAVQAAMADAGDASERLNLFCASYLEHVGADKYLAELIYMEMDPIKKFVPRYCERHFQKLIAILVAIIEDGVASGYFRKGVVPSLSARMIFCSLNETCIYLHTCSSGLQGAKLETFIDSAFFLGLNPDTPVA
ncbi:MAG: Fatty acid metabolism regulator protein [Deltaproteobacteria bacterium ADurb.Bin510]|nr:MAG: Fatty acid metabolism regulator protein [Deltaproteobacteria bacterium ADurb.Bin510]